MTQSISIRYVVLSAVVSIIAGQALRAQEVAPPATVGTTTQKAPLTQADLQAMRSKVFTVQYEILSAEPDTNKLYSVADRSELSKKLMPLLEKLRLITEDYLAADPAQRTSNLIGDRYFFTLSMMAVYGNHDALAIIEKGAAGDPKDYATAMMKRALVAYHWYAAEEKEEKQKPVLAELDAFVQQYPQQKFTALLLAELAIHGTANEDMYNSVMSLLADKYQGGGKEKLKSQIEERAAVTRSADLARKAAIAYLNKPFDLEYTTVDQQKFSISSLKGKVVLIDFWATWCGPCKAELPNVVRTYKKFHDKGLEIVSISLDSELNPLREYLKEHPDLNWIQLFDSSKPGTQELCKKYAVSAIPTMFLVDKNGTLVNMNARGDYENQIAKMLGE